MLQALLVFKVFSVYQDRSVMCRWIFCLFLSFLVTSRVWYESKFGRKWVRGPAVLPYHDKDSGMSKILKTSFPWMLLWDRASRYSLILQPATPGAKRVERNLKWRKGKDQLEYSRLNSVLSLNPIRWEAKTSPPSHRGQTALKYFSFPYENHLVN